MATKQQRRQFDAQSLKKLCKERRAFLSGYPLGDGLLVTDAELAAIWPGGADNAHRGYDAWIYCYGQMTSFARRLELRETKPIEDDVLENAVRAAGLAQPRSVECSDGIARDVHPKGLWALSWLEGFSEVVARMMTPAALDAIEQAMVNPLAKTKAVCAWAWVITTPGPGLPWTDDTNSIEPPEWTRLLAPEDLWVLDKAHREVNSVRLATMAAAFPPQPGAKSRLAIGGMLASYAHEQGIPASEIMRKLSIGEVVAGAIASHEAYRVAEENAQAKRGQR